MKELVLHIEYLLTQHDCIVVPEWGAFVVQYNKATISENKSFIPPTRWISFNSELTHNDGILAHSIMRVENCSYEEALAHITQEVTAWKEQLARQSRFTLGKIGTFEMQDAASLFFIESQDSVVNTTLSMYPIVKLPLISDILSEEEDETVELHINEQSWYHRVWGSVASIAAVIIFMLFVSKPIDNYEATNDYASIVATELLGITEEDHYLCEEDSKSSIEEQPAEESTTKTLEIISAETNEYVEVNVDEYAESKDTYKEEYTHPRYIIVIGSLPTQDLAEQQIKHFETIGITDTIHIFCKDGKYRLYIDGYDTLAEAQQQVNSITSDKENIIQGAWICSTR